VLPFNKMADSDCWVFQVEEIHLCSHEEDTKSFYEYFKFKMSRGSFAYTPPNNSSPQFNLIEDYNMEFNLGMMKSSIKDIKQMEDLAHIKIEGIL
jgi:hypothetical protein